MAGISVYTVIIAKSLEKAERRGGSWLACCSGAPAQETNAFEVDKIEKGGDDLKKAIFC
jgi:hypothetical protein